MEYLVAWLRSRDGTAGEVDLAADFAPEFLHDAVRVSA